MSELLKNLSGKVIESKLFGTIEVHSSWNDFIDEIKDSLSKVEDEMKEVFRSKEIENNFTPKNNVLHFLTRDLKKTKVIVLGQDPYPKRGVATGRAFEIKGLRSWDEKDKDNKEKISNSLKNILKAIHVAYLDPNTDEDKIPFRTLIEKIKNEIAPPEKWFKNMEGQGVLFLNTSLTCKINESNYHRIYWKNFAKEIIHYIIVTKDQKDQNCTWLLWGENARSIVSDTMEELKEKGEGYKNINTNIHDKNCFIKCYTCCHPRLSAFINSENGFKETSKKTDKKYGIDWLGNKT